jgi:predicted SprT family Zn-dependent metalloprotease
MEVRKLIGKWSRLWGTSDLIDAEVVLNDRLRTCLGRSFPDSNRIELNPSLLSRRRSRFDEVLCHEAAHLAAHCLSESREKVHGRTWAALMEAAGFNPRVTVSVRPQTERKRRTIEPQIFEHRCPDCGFTRIARRRVNRWRCRLCATSGGSGILVVRKRPVAKSGSR